MKIYTQCEEVKRVARTAFPDYSGNKFSVDTYSGEMRLDSCWDGGSRDYYSLVDLGGMRAVSIPENGNPFSSGGQIFKASSLPFNVAIVQHTIFCGKDLGITVFVQPENLNQSWLPAPVEMTLAEKIVLTCTRERKSSYNGRNRQQMAFDDCGLPETEWNTAKASCIAKGWLKANGSITDSGRNVCGTQQLWSLKWKAD